MALARTTRDGPFEGVLGDTHTRDRAAGRRSRCGALATPLLRHRRDRRPAKLLGSLWPARRPQRLRSHVASATAGAPLRESRMTNLNSFGSRATLDVAGRRYTIFRLDALASLPGNTVQRLPFSL